jgi:cation:H+ antiporter
VTPAVITLVVGAAFSLAASAVLVTRIERLGERFRLSEAMLGLVAALAADTPEITSASAALAHGQRAVGVGVVLGSNVFNLAALLGLGAVMAGRISLHRRVVALEGAVGLWMAAVSICALAGLIGPRTGLALVLVVLLPYAYLCAVRPPSRGRLRLPAGITRWLAEAITEEEQEVRPALHPAAARPSDAISALTAAIALVIVLVASLAMEQAATSLGTRLAVPPIVTGGIVLAAVTSLPNAVTAVYLARRGRGAATLSEAMNSNTLNVAFGLFLPAAITGVVTAGGSAGLVATWYAVMTLGVLALAMLHSGLTRRTGALVIAAYAAFVVILVTR